MKAKGMQTDEEENPNKKKSARNTSANQKKEPKNCYQKRPKLLSKISFFLVLCAR
jgi:hypothetical protein